MPRIHEALTGHRIEYPDPTSEVEAFIKRASTMSADPAVAEGEMVALIYGAENPIMDRAFSKIRCTRCCRTCCSGSGWRPRG